MPQPRTTSGGPMQDAVAALFDGAGVAFDVLRDLASADEETVLRRLVEIGFTDDVELTDVLFKARHPELGGRALDPSDPADRSLIREWRAIRSGIVADALRRSEPAAAGGMSSAERVRLVDAALAQATSGGDPAARASIRQELEEIGSSVREWFSAIVPDASFLGVPIAASAGSRCPGVHEELRDLLLAAERDLTDAHEERVGSEDVEPGEVARAVGLDSITGLRPPKRAVGGSRPSLHCYGLAVDVNYFGTPFIGQVAPGGTSRPTLRLIREAGLLLHGEPILLEGRTPGGPGATAGETWDVLSHASDTLKTIMSMPEEELAARLARVSGPAGSPSFWRDLIAQVRRLPEWDHHADPARHGFLGVGRELVVALCDHAGLTWGASFKGAKDIMHFDWRGGDVRRD
jgi:hypothetical protein